MAATAVGAAGPRTCFARRFPALGTMATVVTAGGEAIDRAEEVLRHEVEAIDRACSRFRADSEVSRLDQAHGYPVPISPLLAEAVATALMAAEMTDGAVDPTVGAAMVGLGYDRDFDEVPRASAVPSRPRPVPGWRCVELSRSDRLLRVPEGVVLDLGATAKALASDRAAARVAALTGTAVLVNLGGDISVAGAPEEGWAVGIAPDSATAPGVADVVVALRQGGLATSGTSVRTWRRAERQVHHIVDPATGDSAQTCWQLVSVAAPSCVMANAASTAAIVWGEAAPGAACRRWGSRPASSVPTVRSWPSMVGLQAPARAAVTPAPSPAAGRWPSHVVDRPLVHDASDRPGRLGPAYRHGVPRHPDRRAGPSTLPAFARAEVHRRASVLAVAFLAVHVLTAVLDTYVNIGWLAVVVPFTSSYHTFWLALGTIGADLLVAVAISSALRQHIPARTWRALHWLAYLSWPVAVSHVLGMGTDRKLSWVLGLLVVCMATVAAAGAWRVAGAVRAQAALPRTIIAPRRSIRSRTTGATPGLGGRP